MEQKTKKRNAVGGIIRKLRYDQEITQDMLAARCQVAGCPISRGTLAKIEAQIRGISDREIFTIAKVFKIKMEELFPPDFAKKLKRGFH